MYISWVPPLKSVTAREEETRTILRGLAFLVHGLVHEHLQLSFNPLVLREEKDACTKNAQPLVCFR
jgi:hypothetical protein